MPRLKLTDEEREQKRKDRFHRILHPPKMDHAGNPEEWAAQAQNLLNGEGDSFQKAMDTLGISSMPANADELKRVFHKKQMEVHPDRGGTDKASQEVNEAYEVLKMSVAPSVPAGTMPGVKFMLAESDEDVSGLIEDPLWVFEPKLDGTRCAVILNKGTVTLLGRGGRTDSEFYVPTTEGKMRNYNAQFPEIVRAFLPISERELTILDGELVCYDERGEVSFNMIQRRMNRVEDIEQEAEVNPASFIFFDMPVFEGKDIKNLSYDERRGYVVRFEAEESATIHERIYSFPIATTPETKQALWNLTIEAKREGVMAKQIMSPYVGKRDDSWIKIKRKLTVDVIVIGWLPGTGKLSGKETESVIGTDITLRDEKGNPIEVFGALVCAVYKNGKMVEIGKVGGGFSNEDRRDITRQFLKPDIITIKDEEGHSIKVGAVKEPFVIEVETYGLAARKMRMAQYLHLREDKAPQDCEMEQFE